MVCEPANTAGAPLCESKLNFRGVTGTVPSGFSITLLGEVSRRDEGVLGRYSVSGLLKRFRNPIPATPDFPCQGKRSGCTSSAACRRRDLGTIVSPVKLPVFFGRFEGLSTTFHANCVRNEVYGSL
jgi:hypothetical protein